MSSFGGEDLTANYNFGIRFDFDSPSWDAIADTILTPLVGSPKLSKSTYYKKQLQYKLAKYNTLNIDKYKMPYSKQKTIGIGFKKISEK